LLELLCTDRSKSNPVSNSQESGRLKLWIEKVQRRPTDEVPAAG
jgi:hypothetical protein